MRLPICSAAAHLDAAIARPPRYPVVMPKSLALAFLLLAGCPTKVDDTALVCTEIGCVDQVVFVLYDPDGAPYTGAIDVRVEIDGQPTLEFSCPGDTGDGFACGEGAVTVYTAAPLFNATFQSSTLYTSGYVEPEYQPQYPNGEECGAACQQATVDVNLSIDGC
jgi:hypothetical protein